MEEIKWVPFYLETSLYTGWVRSGKEWHELVKKYGYKWLVKMKKNEDTISPEFGDDQTKFFGATTLREWLEDNNLGFIPNLGIQDMEVESFYCQDGVILRYRPAKHKKLLGKFMFWAHAKDISHLLIIGDHKKHQKFEQIFSLLEEFHWKVPKRKPDGVGQCENGIITSWYGELIESEPLHDYQQIIAKAIG